MYKRKDVGGEHESRIKQERAVVGLWPVDLFFQAEDGMRGAQESRGLGDVYKMQRL